MRKVSRFACISTLGLICVAPDALATTDPPTPLDARAAGMGSTAVSHVHNGAAVYHNVAALHEVKKLAITAGIATSRIGLTAPMDGPNTSVDSDSSFVPLYLIGAAYRVSDQVVLGLASYATGGFGAEYTTTNPGVSKLTLGALEISPAVEFSLTKNFALGAGYRITYVMQSAEARVPVFDAMGVPTGMFAASTAELSGFNFAGLHVGAYYRPSEMVRLGLAYRSKVNTHLEGETTTPLGPLDTESDFAFPHGFKLGAAFDAVPEKLLLALELRYLLHGEANEEIVTEYPAAPMLNRTDTLGWKDSVSAGVGLEFHATEMMPLRAGYMASTSATPGDRPGAFFPPPGLLHSIHAGAGVELESLAIDLGGYYALGGADVTSVAAVAPPAAPPPVGRYEFSTLAISLSATYRM